MGSILFTDVSPNSALPVIFATILWKEPRNPLREIDYYSKGGSIVWAVITLDSRTHLHVFQRGTVRSRHDGEHNLELTCRKCPYPRPQRQGTAAGFKD
ncbi:hypothetical protein TNCV_3960451 [Trichonephila clavipes]|nr:hypothetical protein TNCV_3960451 [Trichonephila clavipes]